MVSKKEMSEKKNSRGIKMNTLCISHRGDPDGWFSALVVKHKFPTTETVLVEHGDNIKESDFDIYKDWRIILCDFSFNEPIMNHLKSIAKEFYWIDHHLSAKEVLGKHWEEDKGERGLEHSAATYAWLTFFKDEPMPSSVSLVSDYDTWKKIYGRNTDAFNCYLNCFSFEELSNMKDDLFDNKISRGYITQGKLLLKAKEQRVDRFIKGIREQVITIKGKKYRCGLINTAVDVSMIGNQIASEGYDVGVTYTHNDIGNTKFSLRSIGDIDVSIIARHFGGGGHKNASGFEVEGYLSSIPK